MPMRAELATTMDVPSWSEIVREVEPLFGPMPDFEAMLIRKIDQAAALCIRSHGAGDAACVLGGLLLGSSPPQGWIRWLAVRSRARGTGIGQCLVEAAIERLKGFDRISVDTFRAENIGGRAARRLYERVGFVAGPLVEVGGVPRQRYVLTLV
jgi:GNAT superfamily N-acetyltransferase